MEGKIKSDPQLDAVKKEIIVLFNSFQRIKNELASIQHSSADNDLLGSVSDQLAAISDETSAATNEIMEATEGIQEVNDRLIKEIKFKGAKPNFDSINTNTNRILEACTFHDITGQRMTKIVDAITILETTLNSIATVIGKDALSAMNVEAKTIHRIDSGFELEGPQIGGSELSQADIDSLFD
ncbi:MAG: hypothetical protein HQ483_01260 [Rhodospirillales bacterium]|nr:hypothetical protein [Rhodospirillales bacterium]